MFRPSPVYSNAPGLGRDRDRSPTASATGPGPYGVPALLCNRVGSLLAREVFSASPDRLGERAAPKLTNDARDESPDLLARYPEALRACLTYDLRRPRSPGKVALPSRGCSCPDRLVRLPLQFCGVPALLLDDVEQFLVAVFRHDDLSFLSPTRRKVLRSCPTIEQTCCLCHRRPLSTRIREESITRATAPTLCWSPYAL